MSSSVHVLVADGDAIAARHLCNYLSGFGLQARSVTDGPALQACLATHRVDLLVLDLLLPGARLPSDATLPVIALSTQAQLADRVLGLELGADDFLAKPVEPRELVARIRAVLRRSRAVWDRPGAGAGPASAIAERAPRLQFAGWTLDLQPRRLRAPDGVAVALSDAEHRLLDVFLQHPQRVLARGELAVLVQGRALAGQGRSIDLLVSRLRYKLGGDPQALQPSHGRCLVRTVRGAGYLFDAVPDPA